jgi:hypothetical protein
LSGVPLKYKLIFCTKQKQEKERKLKNQKHAYFILFTSLIIVQVRSIPFISNKRTEHYRIWKASIKKNKHDKHIILSL